MVETTGNRMTSTDTTGKPFRIDKRQVMKPTKRSGPGKGGAGVDGQTIEAFEADLKSNLYRIWNRMSSGSYFPPPVRPCRFRRRWRRPDTGHPDVAGIMHLMQRAFGVMGVDVLNWRPKFEGTGQICRQSILHMVRLACAGAQRQDHG